MRKMIPSKNLIHIRWKNHNLYRQAKAIIIQHQQTSFTANAKGTFLGRKHIYKKKKKKSTRVQVILMKLTLKNNFCDDTDKMAVTFLSALFVLIVLILTRICCTYFFFFF